VVARRIACLVVVMPPRTCEPGKGFAFSQESQDKERLLKRTRSDYELPDLGQMLTWQLSWRHTAMLVDDQRGNCEFDITPIPRGKAGQAAGGLAARYWPPDAARLPWVAWPYPER